MNMRKFDAFYEVYENGEVFSLDRISNGRRYQAKRIKPRDIERGSQVHLHLSDGSDRFIAVAKLVYIAFTVDKNREKDILKLYDSMDNYVVVHKDGDIFNNSFDNLELEQKGVILNTAIANKKSKQAKHILDTK